MTSVLAASNPHSPSVPSVCKERRTDSGEDEFLRGMCVWRGRNGRKIAKRVFGTLSLMGTMPGDEVVPPLSDSCLCHSPPLEPAAGTASGMLGSQSPLSDHPLS